MKSIITLFALSALTWACQSHHYHNPHHHRYEYGQYRDLADALKSESGLRITGFGRNTRIVDTRNLQNMSVQFMINGVLLFDDYSVVNDQVQMSRVQSIRVRKSLSVRATASSNDRTIVEIWTQ